MVRNPTEVLGGSVARSPVVRELIDGAVGLRESNDNMAPGDREWWEAYRSRLEFVAQQARQK